MRKHAIADGVKRVDFSVGYASISLNALFHAAKLVMHMVGAIQEVIEIGGVFP